jgi:hypothetical protein
MWFVLIIGLFLPRLVATILYFFSTWFVGVFQTWYWPLLGFIFMPYTMLWYSAVMNWFGGTWGFWQILILIIAIIADFSSGKKGTEKRA